MLTRLIVIISIAILIPQTSAYEGSERIEPKNRKVRTTSARRLPEIETAKSQIEGSGKWSDPVEIFSTAGELSTSSMALLSDGYGNLHLFFPHAIKDGDPDGIDYAYWNGNRWSAPRDIFIDPDGASLHHLRATLDQEQNIHLTWTGSANKLYYSRSSAPGASNPHSWETPKAISLQSITEADIIAGAEGQLYVVQAIAESNGELVLLKSDDGGSSWSNPITIAPGRRGFVYGRTGIAMDGRGRIHVTWTEHTFPEGVPLTGVFYSRTEDGGLTWERPRLVDDKFHGEIGVGTVGEDGVHLVWRSNIGLDGTFHQWSEDGGVTWSTPDQYDDGGGQSGLPSFGTDNIGRLHHVIGPVFYSMWSDGQSSDYRDIATAEVRAQAELSPGEHANLAVVNGNQIHVIFETGFKDLWHTYLNLDIQPSPTAVPMVHEEETAALDLDPELAPVKDNSTAPIVEETKTPSWSDDPPADDNPFSSLFISVLASGVIVVLVASIMIFRRRK